jgi:hypothetical protein
MRCQSPLIAHFQMRDLIAHFQTRDPIGLVQWTQRNPENIDEAPNFLIFSLEK